MNVLVIGASRGLGLALAREWLLRGSSVVATFRAGGEAGLLALRAEFETRLSLEQLDVTEPAAVDGLRERLAGQRFDVLFINAGVALGPGDRVDDVSTDDFGRLMITNALSPMRLIARCEHLVADDGTIAVMSSGLGSVSLNESGGWETYRASKAALNTLMRSYTARTAGSARTLALVAPGWVRTEMGGDGAPLGVEDSIPRVVDQLAARRGTPGLHYFNYQGDTLPW